jgi:hypothetical protein
MLTSMPRTRYTLFLEDYQREALKLVKAKDGIPESEQIRRAIDEWHARRAIRKKTAKPARRKRADRG